MGGKEPIPKVKSYCKPLDRVNANIDALIIRKKDGACCFRINKNSLTLGPDEIVIDNTPHITGIIPYNEKPVISNQFVGLTDDSVLIIRMDYPLVLIGFYA